jgi:hypothetical protein
MKMSPLARLLLLLAALLSAYQVVAGIEGLAPLAILAHSIAFGVLLVACLLLLILGYEALDSALVTIVSTLIPLALSFGLVWQAQLAWSMAYLAFTALGFAAVVVTRSLARPAWLPTATLALVHGISGLVIVLLPLFSVIQGKAQPAFALVSLGGALIGLGGLLLAFMKAGRPVLPRQTILRILPGLLLAMNACFALGFALGLQPG